MGGAKGPSGGDQKSLGCVERHEASACLDIEKRRTVAVDEKMHGWVSSTKLEAGPMRRGALLPLDAPSCWPHLRPPGQTAYWLAAAGSSKVRQGASLSHGASPTRSIASTLGVPEFPGSSLVQRSRDPTTQWTYSRLPSTPQNGVSQDSN